MKQLQTLATYDDAYAGSYNERFLFNGCQARSDYEIETLRQLLNSGGPWLDVACGTGYVLSRFPGVERAGLDLAPAMLKLARRANPDALFFREGDFLQPAPEWRGQWALVTCMWYAYTMVESMADVERVVENLANWTSDEGQCFVPLCDPSLLAPGVSIPYSTTPRIYGGTLQISGVVWTYVDEFGKRHDNLIAPHVEHMVTMFKKYFDIVEIVEYPLAKLDLLRRALVAKAKKRSFANEEEVFARTV